MKRIINIIATLGLLLTASCQKEQFEPSYHNGDGNTCITLELGGEPLTKADSDLPELNVYYEIYEDSSCERRLFPAAEGDFPSDDMPNVVAVGADGNAYINVKLLRGKQYWFVFWAMEKGAPYSWKSLDNISMNWNEVGNVDNRDAFYGSCHVTEGESLTVTLVRPFAQINFGARLEEMAYGQDNSPCAVSTWAENSKSYYPFKSSKVTVSGDFADTFNASDATASASAPINSLIFKAEALYGSLEPEDYMETDNNTYIHVAMNYLLPVSDSEKGIMATVEVEAEFVVEDGDMEIAIVHEINNVPLEDNKRTNLYGSLFTADGQITVNMSDWEDVDNNINLWDGSAEEVTPENGEYVIMTAEQLAWVAEQVNSGADDFKDKTIRLGADIDLTGSEWTPIGASEKEEYAFRGTFDGAKTVTAVRSSADTECYKISNITVNVEDAGAGLFGFVQEAVIKNLNLENVKITHADRPGELHSGSGAIVGTATYGAKIENVWVTNVSIESNHYAGGIAGYLAGRIADCHVDGLSIVLTPDEFSGEYDNGDKAGGILGYQQGPGNSSIDNEITGCSAKNVSITGTRDMGGIVGYAHVAPTSCVVENLLIDVDQSLLPEAKDINSDIFVGRKAANYIEGTEGNGSAGSILIKQAIEKGIHENLIDKTIEITDLDGLFHFAKMVNENGENFAGKTVELANSIDMNNQSWTPIGLNADDSKKFKGTFDGKNFVLSNLNVDTEPGYTAAGLFGALNGTVQNLTIENASVKHISTGDPSDNGIAVVAGSVYNTGNILNVTVRNATVEGNRYIGGISGYTYGNIKDCTVEGKITLKAVPNNTGSSYDNGDKVGGIAGYFASEGLYVISGNTVSGFDLYAYRDVGGIIGSGDNITGKVINNKSSNGTITADQSVNFYADKDFNAAPIVGRITSGELDESNTYEAVEIITKKNSQL